jgi:hypothetical protein
MTRDLTLYGIFLLLVYLLLESVSAFTPKLNMQVNNWRGINTMPIRDSYEYHIKGRGDLDLFTISTCHRYEALQNPSNVFKTIFKIKDTTEFKFTFTPTPLERDGYCPTWLHAFEKSKNRHSKALILYKKPDLRLVATIHCDGETFESRGVAGCNAKMGTVQAIEFKEPVSYTSDCLDFKKKFQNIIGYKSYIKLRVEKDGVCAYMFKGKDSNEFFRFVIISYDGEEI